MLSRRTSFLLSACAIIALALNVNPLTAATLGVVVDDSFADGDRAKTGALDADWWSSSSTSGSNVQDDVGSLTLVTGTSGRGMHATFAPQNLSVGQTITATYTFTTPETVGTNRSGGFKVALADGSDPLLADDLSSSSSSVNPLYTDLPAYMTDFDINLTGSNLGKDDISIREHLVPNALGRFLGTSGSGEWTSLGSSSDAGYSIVANTEYTGVISITRTAADTADIFGSLSQGTTLLDSYTRTDSSDIANNIGVLAFWANSNTFGTSNSGGDPDNGMSLTNVLIEVTGPVEIPEPSSLALGLSTLALLSFSRRQN